MPRATTKTKKAKFLDGIERDMRVADAARHAKVTRGTPYAWAREDEGFNRAWNVARDSRQDMLVDEATDNALEGDGTMIRFLIERNDRRDASRQEPTIGEIVILGPQDIDASSETQAFLTLELPDDDHDN